MKARLGATVACLMLAIGPATAGGITGAGSGSTGGTLDGKTNESSMSIKTGVDNGRQPVTNGNPNAGVGTGDNAVLNAPGEAPPASKPGSLPSNLNGKYQ